MVTFSISNMDKGCQGQVSLAVGHRMLWCSARRPWPDHGTIPNSRAVRDGAVYGMFVSLGTVVGARGYFKSLGSCRRKDSA